MASTWIFQDPKQVAKYGAEGASWYVGWYDPEGKKRCKSCGPGDAGKKAAFRLARKRQAELIEGTYQSNAKVTWERFRKEYEDQISSGLDKRTQDVIRNTLNQFERIIKPGKMSAIKTKTIDIYRAKRRTEPGRRKGKPLSPATLNKELRHLRAVLKKAAKWKYLEMPDFEFEREMKKLPLYVTREHFEAIYLACDGAKQPIGLPYPPADWWRALLVTAVMTGWRIGDLLALRRTDVDLAEATAVTRYDDNKSGRDDKIRLHAVIVEHLKRIADSSLTVFPWDHDIRLLYSHFLKIQKAAGIELKCAEKHEHTPFCFVYTFHDLRRAFATMNAGKLSVDALQTLMRHKSYATTQLYINMAEQMDDSVNSLHVPEVLKPPQKD